MVIVGVSLSVIVLVALCGVFVAALLTANVVVALVIVVSKVSVGSQMMSLTAFTTIVVVAVVLSPGLVTWPAAGSLKSPADAGFAPLPASEYATSTAPDDGLLIETLNESDPPSAADAGVMEIVGTITDDDALVVGDDSRRARTSERVAVRVEVRGTD